MEQGVYLGASALILPGITDPAILESLACREAFALAADLGLPRFYVASDCKQVVDDIKEGSLGKYGSVIQEITARRNQFAECTIYRVRREIKQFEAHNLARHVLNIDAGRHL
jgi:hypothetical protein